MNNANTVVHYYDTILISEACFGRLFNSLPQLNLGEVFTVPFELCVHDHFNGTFYWVFGKHPSSFGLQGTMNDYIKKIQLGELGNQVPVLTFVNWVRRYREVNGADLCQCSLIGCTTQVVVRRE